MPLSIISINGRINGNIVIRNQSKLAQRLITIIIKGILEQKCCLKISAKCSRKLEISAKIHLLMKVIKKIQTFGGGGMTIIENRRVEVEEYEKGWQKWKGFHRQ